MSCNSLLISKCYCWGMAAFQSYSFHEDWHPDGFPPYSINFWSREIPWWIQIPSTTDGTVEEMYRGQVWNWLKFRLSSLTCRFVSSNHANYNWIVTGKKVCRNRYHKSWRHIHYQMNHKGWPQTQWKNQILSIVPNLYYTCVYFSVILSVCVKLSTASRTGWYLTRNIWNWSP